MSRSAWSAWSLLPLWGAAGGPKAPASWPHSKRFARIASRAAQPVRTPLERIGALRHAVGAWFPVITFGIPPDPHISRRSKASKAATTVFSKEEEVEREWYTPIESTTGRRRVRA